MNVAIIVAAKQKQILRKFEQREATDPDRARSLTDLDCRDSIVFRRLIGRGVIQETIDGRFYVDAETSQRLRARGRGLVLLAILVVVTMVIVLTWFG